MTARRFTKAQQAQINDLCQQHYEAGRIAGRAAGLKEAREEFSLDRARAITNLANAIGQTMQSQSMLVEGLARALENGLNK